MTRLTSRLIEGMDENIASYDNELIRKTGLSLRQIAARAAGTSEEALCQALSSECIAVVPVTAGQGVIGGFTRAVQVIIHHLGCPSFITDDSDTAGLAEGIERGATILFQADDCRFVAVNLSRKRVTDNAEATGWSYACALDACSGGLKGRDVLLIGAGRVGENAICALERLGANVGVFDIDEPKSRLLAAKYQINQEGNLSEALERYTLFFDASPAPDIIHKEHIKPDTAIAACGIPIGLSEEARHLVEGRLIHDPLQLGTAAMLAMAVSHGWNDKQGGRSDGSHRP
jgi:pyrrolysine biosynthesis protein PylD